VTRISDRGDALYRPRHTADGRQDPDFIARPHATVAAPVAGKLEAFGRRKGARGDGLVTIAFDAAQQGFDIVVVDMGARGDQRRRAANRPAIFADHVSRRDFVDCDLVARENRFADHELPPGEFNPFSRFKRPQRDRDII